ncbi:hypothetical protein MsAc7_08720 [Methanolapillus millepedarum]|uniref:Uncharacterized protein n=1 Tax=Methanolapillus millepedarum TaxID=3028296 RepID=A0AA96VEV3_9EURY|nr:hypothetical protein MsAc7_08720 [Methanosarcinaceae archaeon Ac7]
MKKFQNRQTSKKSCFELKFKKEKYNLKNSIKKGAFCAFSFLNQK